MATVILSQMKAAAKADPEAPTGTTTYKDAVLMVEKALVAEGLLATRWVDGSFGTKTVDAYADWQRSLGYSGEHADGVPGLQSLTELGKRHGFTVVDD